MDESPIQLHISVAIDRDGHARSHGSTQIKDGASNTVLLAEAIPTTASCADTDEDGVAGLTLLQFVMRDVRSGELVPVSVIPNRGEIEESGEELVTIVIGAETFVERVRVHLRGFLTRPPK